MEINDKMRVVGKFYFCTMSLICHSKFPILSLFVESVVRNRKGNYDLITCMGEAPLSTLSIPSLATPPPRIAVRILRPIVMRPAHGEGATDSVSKLSLLLGPVAVPGLKIICIIIPEIKFIGQIYEQT